MKVGIYTNIHKDKNLSVTKKLIESFLNCGIECYAYESLSSYVVCNGYFSESDNVKLDMLLAVGGDGTLLSISKW